MLLILCFNFLERSPGLLYEWSSMKNQTEKIKMLFSFQIGYIFFIKHDFGRSLSPYVLTKRVFMKKKCVAYSITYKPARQVQRPGAWAKVNQPSVGRLHYV